MTTTEAARHANGVLATLVDEFERLSVVRRFRDDVWRPGQVSRVRGIVGSADAVLVAARLRRPGTGLAIVANSPQDAERWLADLTALVGDGVAHYPQRESLGEEEHNLEIAGERAETLEALQRGAVRIVVTTARATAERTQVSQAIAFSRLDLTGGCTADLSDVVARLERMGYHRVPAVTDVAEFSVRGGILDLYGFGMPEPARLEWWGDELHSLRAFDLDTQRSGETLDRVTVLPVNAMVPDVGGPPVRRSLLDLLPDAFGLWLDDSAIAAESIRRMWEEAAHHLEVARRMGEEPPARDDLFIAPEAWAEQTARLHVVRVTGPEGDSVEYALELVTPETIDRNIAHLRRVIASEPPTMVLCDNEGQLERLEDLLADHRGRVPDTATLTIGSLHGGFAVPNRLRVLTDHEIFRRARRLRRARRYRQAAAPTPDAFRSGDFVVHLEHGIGIYRGVETIEVGESTMDVAVVEYLGGDLLHVPLYRIDQLEPYRTPDKDGGRPAPKIHRLGGSTWQRQRAKARQAIEIMAGELLELYAQRRVAPGYAFPADTNWQRELESSFLYEDTPDQRRASVEVKRDMERPHPMDRLVVGDAGYGKTEVAVRAAFKAIQAGKQVALLVPTTILAEQHGRTFEERLADYPVRVGVLSRFRSAKEQRDLVARVVKGEIDVIIGTHRLLSRDVRFADLGLLIVDEEHRFGVRHKERLKQLRLSVDVLVLTATPIPRTLSLSLAGLRDFTLIETAPRDRSPVLTYLEPWDDGLLEEAMARELDRGGQVFFVHNRVETIDTIAARVQRLAPRARIAVGHGQLPERDLDEVMRRFVRHEVDILVATMIVESGLDVPNANTMIVHDAHRFGLAQLYQLRGRVGRGHRRAYCFLVVPDNIDPQAEERLKVLEHHSGLGAGYRIALRDLELRGAGNLLGPQQSGHAQAVGYDTYLRWMDETVQRLKGDQRIVDFAPPKIVMDRTVHLPDDYVPDDGAKLDLYRRLARAEENDDIARLRDELRDRFGPLPEPAERLLLQSELRVLGGRLGLDTILLHGDQARLEFRAEARPRLASLTTAFDDVQFAAEVRRHDPLVLKLERLGGETIERGLVRVLGAVSRIERDT